MNETNLPLHQPATTPSESGKLWAALSYASVFLGFPLGVIPLVQRDDAFALHHAKHATATWLVAFVGSMVLTTVTVFSSFLTFGLSTLLLFPFIGLLGLWVVCVAIHGLILALNGEWRTTPLALNLGETFFGSIRPNP